MSSTSTTQYYGLTQYVGTDKPDFADNNTAFREVDAALHGVVQDAEGFTTDIANLQTDVAAAQSDITTLQTDLDTAEAAIVSIQNKDLAQDAEIARVDTNSKDLITAYNEASATSTHAYVVGDYFIYNNVLYRATAAIAIGETIVPDTNCTTTNVTSELIQLNSDLAALVATSSSTNISYKGLNFTIEKTGQIVSMSIWGTTNDTIVADESILGLGAGLTTNAELYTTSWNNEIFYLSGSDRKLYSKVNIASGSSIRIGFTFATTNFDAL